MQILDTEEVLLTKGLLNCGVMDLFVGSGFVKQNHLTMKQLSQPIPVYNIDGSLNEAGSISEIWETILQYCEHSEHVTFTVTSLGKQDIILGLTWLQKYNTEVDQASGKIKMSRCPNHCRTCQNKANDECKVVFKEAASICTCHVGPMPSTDIEMEDVPSLELDNEDDNNKEPYIGEDLLKAGDQIFVATIFCKAEFICATLNVSQQLAKAFHKNTQPKIKMFHKSVLTHFYNFEDLFAKLSFDHLPDCKVWDHAIELVPGAKASSFKVYLLVSSEQMEMDAFIQSNGHI